MTYRADIDGLRALSVALVVLYHLGVAGVSGGFVGVDVFFVISGYLITGIIVGAIESGTFSLVSFYERRIKRIFPALLAMVVVTMACGPFLLLPGDYEVMARSAIYAVASLSNFYFLFNTGYFDVASEMMPLLHTWSLAVEEQFYAVWPVVLVAIAVLLGKSRLRIGIACFVLAAVSFASSVDLVATDPKAAFYLPYTRAWELATGALLAIIPRQRWALSPRIASIACLIGLTLIFYSAFALTKDSPFPGTNALYPVVGATLVIAPWRTGGIVQRVLSLSPLVFLGRVSYSLYLWHWPIIVLYRHYNLEAPVSPAAGIGLGVIMLTVSWLSWRFVEQPLRHAPTPRWANIGAGIGAATAVALVAFGITSADGFPQRIPAKANGLNSLDEMWQWNCKQMRSIEGIPGEAQCIIGADWETARVRGVLWGDSHAEHFAPLLDRPASEAGVALVLFRACMPLIGENGVRRVFPTMPTYTEACVDAHKPMLKLIQGGVDIDLLVLASAWAAYLPDLYLSDPEERSASRGAELLPLAFDSFLGRAARADLRVLILSDVPARKPYGLGCLFERDSILFRQSCPSEMIKTPIHFVTRQHAAANAVIRALPDRWPNVHVVMPQDVMCDQEGCPTTLNGEFLYRDQGHIRRNLTAETQNQLARSLRLKEALLGTVNPQKVGDSH